MSKDFLKGDTPDVWTREDKRIELFTDLEKDLFRAELQQDFFTVLKIARMILRLQMEVMKEKNEEGRDLIGVDTPTFKTLKEEIIDLQEKLAYSSSGRTSDPTRRSNNRQDHQQVVSDIENLLDKLFNNNTILGLNYKKKDDPMKAYYGNK